MYNQGTDNSFSTLNYKRKTNRNDKSNEISKPKALREALAFLFYALTVHIFLAFYLSSPYLS